MGMFTRTKKKSAKPETEPEVTDKGEKGVDKVSDEDNLARAMQLTHVFFERAVVAGRMDAAASVLLADMFYQLLLSEPVFHADTGRPTATQEFIDLLVTDKTPPDMVASMMHSGLSPLHMQLLRPVVNITVGQAPTSNISSVPAVASTSASTNTWAKKQVKDNTGKSIDLPTDFDKKPANERADWAKKNNVPLSAITTANISTVAGNA